jgi:hypothetical protein
MVGSYASSFTQYHVSFNTSIATTSQVYIQFYSANAPCYFQNGYHGVIASDPYNTFTNLELIQSTDQVLYYQGTFSFMMYTTRSFILGNEIGFSLKLFCLSPVNNFVASYSINYTANNSVISTGQVIVYEGASYLSILSLILLIALMI